MTVVVSQTQRGPGLIDSGNQDIATVLGSAPQAGFKYTLTALMQNADINDATLTITGISISLDGNVVYGPTQWTGGQAGRDGVVRPPTYFYSPGDAIPTTVRLQCNLPKRMSFGLDLTQGPVVQ